MEIDRRSLFSVFGLGALALAHPGLVKARERGLFAAARKEPDGNYAAVLFDSAGNDLLAIPLPGRGHDIAPRPGVRECVVFARRPGTFAIAFGPDRKAAPKLFTAQAGRHFYGHGTFSPGGRLLYTSENDIGSGAGVIGVRDATANYRPVGAFSSGGIGPHDMALMSDGRTLVVANGGIRTHPDFGRRPLNLASMQPSLAYIDRFTGDLVESVRLPAPLSQLSIRHLAVAGPDRIVFGAQHKGPKSARPPLIGLHEPGQDIRLFGLGEEVYGRLRNYVTSVAADEEGDFAVATSAPGGVALVLDMRAGNVAALNRIADVSGLARRADGRGFLATSGTGTLTSIGGSAHQCRFVGRAQGHWDNHAVGLGWMRGNGE